MNIRSISTKVLLTLILTIILTFSFFFYILMYSYRNEKLHKINQAGQEAMTRLLTTSSLLYSAESTESSINFAEHSFYNEMTINSSIQSITLYSIDNSLKLRFERNEQWLPIQVNTEPSFQYDPQIINILKEDVILKKQKAGSLEIILSNKIINKNNFDNFDDIIFAMLFIIVFSSIVIFMYLEISIISPLKTLIKSVKQYRDSGYVGVTLVPSGSSEDEISLLIHEFNELMTDLTKSFEHKAFLIRQLKLNNENMQKEIKDRIYAEKSERSAQEYMNTVFNLVPAMLAITDEELMITLMNEQMRIFTGEDSENVKIPLSDILPFTDNLTNLMYSSLKECKVQVFQCSDKNKHYTVTLNPFKYRGGTRAIIRLDDITDTITKENALLNHFRIEDTKRLLYQITHNFNNLLGGITGATFLAKLELKELSEENPTLQEMLDIIETASKKSCNLIKKLSLLSYWDDDITSEVDLFELLNNILSILSASIPQKIAIHFSDNLHGKKALIQGNFRQLEQIFLSLILNAVNAITVALENNKTSDGELKINLQKEIIDDGSDCYCIEIQDNGIGIEETKLKALLDSQYFDDNENKKVQGLAICKNLIKRHNGWLGTDSQINKGCVFRVYLPIIKKPKTLDNTEKILAVPENGKTILVIDDNEMMLKIASQMLNKCGHKVLLANNGTDGIQTFKNNSGISLVLLDLIMPDLSGLDVFYQLRQLRSDIPIIFMSGINEKKELTDCKGYNGFLTKPYSLNELSRKIFDVLK